MDAEKRPSLSEYPEWLSKTTGIAIDGQLERQFKLNVIAAFTTAQDHPFIRGLEASLANIAAQYEQQHGAQLFTDDEPPSLEILQKTFASALDKSFRKNVIKNTNFPSEPTGGWLVPRDWFSKMNDLIRGSLTCRYIDGPRFVAEKLHEIAKAGGHKSRFDPVQLDRGYYAYHFYIEIDTDIPYLVQSRTPVLLEIQLTTQLQEIVLDLTHRFYEDLRLKEADHQRDDQWKWEYKSARFKASYLSHTLHLLEGLIAEVRERAAADRFQQPQQLFGPTQNQLEQSVAPPTVQTEENATPHEQQSAAAPEATDPSSAAPPDDSSPGTGG